MIFRLLKSAYVEELYLLLYILYSSLGAKRYGGNSFQANRILFLSSTYTPPNPRRTEKNITPVFFNTAIGFSFNETNSVDGRNLFL